MHRASAPHLEGSLARIQNIPNPATRPTISALEAFALLGISEHTGRALIHQGKFPVPVLRLGRNFKVPLAPLLELLGQTDHSAPPTPAA
jgi:hypothetical protein